MPGKKSLACDSLMRAPDCACERRSRVEDFVRVHEVVLPQEPQKTRTCISLIICPFLPIRPRNASRTQTHGHIGHAGVGIIFLDTVDQVGGQKTNESSLVLVHRKVQVPERGHNTRARNICALTIIRWSSAGRARAPPATLFVTRIFSTDGGISRLGRTAPTPPPPPPPIPTPLAPSPERPRLWPSAPPPRNAPSSTSKPGPSVGAADEDTDMAARLSLMDGSVGYGR